MTFSLLLLHLPTGTVGAAVQSKCCCVGAVVPHCEAATGGVLTQSKGNPEDGRRGLSLLRKGVPASQVVKIVLSDQPEEQVQWRQLAVLDNTGGVAVHQGEAVLPCNGHVEVRTEQFVCVCIGNILISNEVLPAMAKAVREAVSSLPDDEAGDRMPDVLLAALCAGQRAGGDRRGQESAAMVVARPGQIRRGIEETWVDLRVDSHPHPIDELQRVFRSLDAQFLCRPCQQLCRSEYEPRVARALDTLQLASLKDWVDQESILWLLAELELTTHPGTLPLSVIRFMEDQADLARKGV